MTCIGHPLYPIVATNLTRDFLLYEAYFVQLFYVRNITIDYGRANGAD
jgi:hypothetical protein